MLHVVALIQCKIYSSFFSTF